jgi:hypothetical protein
MPPSGANAKALLMQGWLIGSPVVAAFVTLYQCSPQRRGALLD